MPPSSYTWTNPVAITDNGNTPMFDMPHDGILTLFAGIVAYDTGVFKVQWSMDGTTWVDSGLTLAANGVDGGDLAQAFPSGAKLRLNVAAVAGAAMDAPIGTVRIAGASADMF